LSTPYLYYKTFFLNLKTPAKGRGLDNFYGVGVAEGGTTGPGGVGTYGPGGGGTTGPEGAGT